MITRLGTLDLDETIVIDGEVIITLMDIQGGQVRFSIDAPNDVKVYHEGLYQRTKPDSNKT